MICARFAPVVIVLVGLAGVPTLIHSYFGTRHVDGRVTDAISDSLAGLHSEATSRPGRWVQETFESGDWIERRYIHPAGGEVVLFVARSYDPKRLYHHPELGVLHGRALRDLGRVRLPLMPDVPVHVLRPLVEGRRGLAAYSLSYDERFVDNPYLFQLRTALQLMISGQRQMTLFFAYEPTFPADAAVERAMAIDVLFGAIRSFLSQTASRQPGAGG